MAKLESYSTQLDNSYKVKLIDIKKDDKVVKIIEDLFSAIIDKNIKFDTDKLYNIGLNFKPLEPDKENALILKIKISDSDVSEEQLSLFHSTIITEINNREAI
jgi:hypothetical protein